MRVGQPDDNTISTCADAGAQHVATWKKLNQENVGVFKWPLRATAAHAADGRQRVRSSTHNNNSFQNELNPRTVPRPPLFCFSNV